MQNNMWMKGWNKKQIQFQPAESKERDTTIVIDEEEEQEDDVKVRESADKSKFDFSSIAYGDKERAG